MAKQKSVDAEENKDLDEDEDSDAEGADKEDGEDDDQEKVDDEDEEDDNDEPRVRRNLSHIIARKNRTIEKLRKKDDEEDSDDDEDAEVEDRVGKAVRRTIAPLAKDLDEKQVGIEISSFLSDPKNARFRKYERAARRYALHPAYQNVPIDGIFKQLAFDDVDSGSEHDESSRRERATRQSSRGNTMRQAPASDSEKISRLGFRDKEFKTIRERIGAGETIDLKEE